MPLSGFEPVGVNDKVLAGFWEQRRKLCCFRPPLCILCRLNWAKQYRNKFGELMMKHATDWVWTSDLLIRSPARYPWTTISPARYSWTTVCPARYPWTTICPARYPWITPRRTVDSLLTRLLGRPQPQMYPPVALNQFTLVNRTHKHYIYICFNAPQTS